MSTVLEPSGGCASARPCATQEFTRFGDRTGRNVDPVFCRASSTHSARTGKPLAYSESPRQGLPGTPGASLLQRPGPEKIGSEAFFPRHAAPTRPDVTRYDGTHGTRRGTWLTRQHSPQPWQCLTRVGLAGRPCELSYRAPKLRDSKGARAAVGPYDATRGALPAPWSDYELHDVPSRARPPRGKCHPGRWSGFSLIGSRCLLTGRSGKVSGGAVRQLHRALRVRDTLPSPASPCRAGCRAREDACGVGSYPGCLRGARRFELQRGGV